MLGIVCISKVWEPLSPRKNYSLQGHPSWTHWPHSGVIYRTSGSRTPKPYIWDTDNYFFTFAFKEQGIPIECDGCPFYSHSRPILVPVTILLSKHPRTLPPALPTCYKVKFWGHQNYWHRLWSYSLNPSKHLSRRILGGKQRETANLSHNRLPYCLAWEKWPNVSELCLPYL